MNEPKIERYLVIPTEPYPCWIPLGMTKENFDLLEGSLQLWRDRILLSGVPHAEAESATVEGKDK
jgi:hypothetical protein